MTNGLSEVSRSTALAERSRVAQRIPMIAFPIFSLCASAGSRSLPEFSSRLRKNVIFEPIFLMAGRRQVRMMAAGARRVRAVRPVLLSSSFLQTDSSRRCQKLWDADNVVGGGSENEEPRDEGPPAMTGLAHHPHSLHPAPRPP